MKTDPGNTDSAGSSASGSAVLEATGAGTLPQDADLEGLIQQLEAGYEFLLAFAAQGREEDLQGGRSARATLESMAQQLQRLDIELHSFGHEFAEITRSDLKKVSAALDLIQGLPEINSELIDNLNASIHLRALLTDLFVLSEANRLSQRGG